MAYSRVAAIDREQSVDAELLWALVATALLLNGLVKIDTTDCEKLGWNL